VIEGALPLLEKIDAAVFAAQSSRRKARSRNNPTESTTANPSSQKRPWRERSKDTIWDDPKSIIANFPPRKGKEYGCIQPHPRMFMKIDCPLLKAHAITCYHSMSGPEQKLVKQQLVALCAKEMADNKAGEKEALSTILSSEH
jgi:hypothetical protein